MKLHFPSLLVGLVVAALVSALSATSRAAAPEGSEPRYRAAVVGAELYLLHTPSGSLWRKGPGEGEGEKAEWVRVADAPGF